MGKHQPPEGQLARWLDAVADIATAVGGDEPVSDLLGRVARTACTLLGYDFCGVFLPTPTGAALVIAGSHGLSAEYVAQVNADRPILLNAGGEDEAPTSLAFRTGRVVSLEDIQLVPGFGPWGGVAHEQGYRSLVSVPLMRSGRAVGTLNCYRRRPHRFDQTELGLIATLATQVTIALGTAQLRARERETIKELQRAEEIHDLLTATALRGEGVAGVASALAGLLGREVSVEEPRGVEATMSRPDDARLPQGDQAVSGGRSARVVDVDLGESPEVVTAVVLDGREVAHIRVAGTLVELSSLDVRALEHAATVTALELLKERTAAEVEQRLRGSLVADLLAADAADQGPLLARAQRLGWDLSGRQTLAAIRLVESGPGRGRPVADSGAATVLRLLGDLVPPPLVAAHRGEVIVLWPEGATVARAGRPADPVVALRRLVGSLSASPAVERAVAVVAPPAAPGELGFSFRMARGALDLAGSGTDDLGVIDLTDTAIDHLLLQLDDPARLRAFATHVLGAALRYDAERSTSLVSTARVLLEHDLDRRSAAAALHLHPNTVLQRTRRLEELTGLRLARPRDLLQLTAALTVARIAGLG